MKTQAQVLRIYHGELDKHGHRPLYEAIVEMARKRGLAGATVLRGVVGFGESKRLQVAKMLRLSEDLPVVVEIVDSPDKIALFVADLEPLVDKDYDADAILLAIAAAGGEAVVPPKANRVVQRDYDTTIYRERNRIERFFQKIKNYRRIATPYERLAATFLAMLHLIACVVWLTN